ncbi:isovaleryl-CoA dehydrogenase, mitochondrial [Dermatophagoides pteronyssinus]|uniref:isovaleryl-CoA dehydrogenase, mitochondrial n=1 Tax=Dermatophagoides pteronyssinus TaxID=6956 RepID=UPI003F66BE6F
MLFQSKNFRQILFRSIRRYYQQQTENIVDNFVANRTPSIIWNSDVLHGLTSEQIEFRQMVRNFAEKELPEELVQKIDHNGHYDDFRKFWKKLGSMGLLGITAPVEYGGLGLDYFNHVLAMEELSRCAGGLALSYGAHSNLCINQISLHGNDEQKSRFLPRLIDGTFIGSLAMSEVTSGSDVTSMRTTAKKPNKNSDYYLLNGHKFWITNGPEADVVFVYAKTSEKGISAFLVEKDMEGFQVGQIINKLGMKGSPTSELLFDNVKIPETNLIGKIDSGVYILMSGLDSERLVLSGGPLGLMQSACELAFKYVHERKQFNKPIGSFQIVQGKMADMYSRLSMCRSYLYNVSRALDQYKQNQKQQNAENNDQMNNNNKRRPGPSPYTKDCAAVILTLAETSTQLALDTIQMLGGNGYTNDYSAGRILRDSKLYEIGAGTSEIRRWLIGRELNKEYLQ